VTLFEAVQDQDHTISISEHGNISVYFFYNIQMHISAMKFKERKSIIQ